MHKNDEAQRERVPAPPSREPSPEPGEGEPQQKPGASATKGTKTPAGAKSETRKKNNVRKIRLERMMSKAELARRAAVSTLTIDRIERGMPCRMDTKRKILEALGLSPSDREMVFGPDDDRQDDPIGEPNDRNEKKNEPPGRND